MSARRNHVLHALVLAVSLGSVGSCAVGCAGFGSFETEESPPLPATIGQLRSAIEAERARLKELVGEPANDSEPLNVNADALIAVAERLSRLQAALEQLEHDAGSEATVP